MARPTHQPLPALRRQVEAMAGYGVPEIDIGRVIGIDPKTLRKHYRDELDQGQVKANAKVAENLYRKATGEGREAVTAAIFWLKTRARWKETSVHELGGAVDLPPLRVERVIIDSRSGAGSKPDVADQKQQAHAYEHTSDQRARS